MSSHTTYLRVDDAVVSRINSIGQKRQPNEACGILLPECHEHEPPCDNIIELSNMADLRQSSCLGKRRAEDPRFPNQEGGDGDTILLDPQTSYAIDEDELWEVFERYLQAHPEQAIRWMVDTETGKNKPLDEELWRSICDGYLLWHTHHWRKSVEPGPSAGDMRFRIPGVRYLVVVLADPARPGSRPIAVRF